MIYVYRSVADPSDHGVASEEATVPIVYIGRRSERSERRPHSAAPSKLPIGGLHEYLDYIPIMRIDTRL